MDFTIDSEQQALVEASRALLTRVYDSSETRRAATKTDRGFTAWERLAEMGLLSLPFEATHTEVALVAEELGKVIAPDPFIESTVLAGGLIAAVGTDEQQAELVEAVAEGTTLPVLAWLEEGRGWDSTPERVRYSDGRLTGSKVAVIQAHNADLLVVSAATDAGTGLFLVRDGFELHTARTHDGSSASTVVFDGTPAEPLGDGGDASAALDRALDLARIAYGHEALGAMQVALDQTVDYLKTRKQFGVTLNTFQALNFRAADMYVALELARSTIMWATMVAADEQSTDAQIATAASQSALQVISAGSLIGLDAVQLHGGIGMTAEYSVGHYTARLLAIQQLIGDERFHLDRLAARVGGHDVFDPIG